MFGSYDSLKSLPNNHVRFKREFGAKITKCHKGREGIVRYHVYVLIFEKRRVAIDANLQPFCVDIFIMILNFLE